MKTIMPLFEELVKKICDFKSAKLVKIMEVEDNISEFDLADKMKVNVNEMRSMLYKLSEHNLVYSTRKKDKDKGWYIYYWSFNFRHARDLLIQQKNKELKQFHRKLNIGSHSKYICENSCGSYSLEKAMDLNFRCPECNSLLKLREVRYNSEIIKKRISEIEEQIEMLNKAVIIERVSVKKKEEKKAKKKTKGIKRKVKRKKTKGRTKRKATKKKPRRTKREKKPKKQSTKKTKKRTTKSTKKRKPKRTIKKTRKRSQKKTTKKKPKKTTRRKPAKKKTKSKIHKRIKKKPRKKTIKPKKNPPQQKSKNKNIIGKLKKKIKF